MTRIRELRQGKGLKAIDLAYAIHVHPALLSSIERRKLAASVKAKGALCSFFGVKEGEMFDADGLAV
jgi:ribosome-binding protein aMBF1 (putative translation factor)